MLNFDEELTQLFFFSFTEVDLNSQLKFIQFNKVIQPDGFKIKIFEF